MKKQLIFITLNFLLLLATINVTIGQDKPGKFFIKGATTEVDGQQIPDEELEAAVKDIKKSIGQSNLANKESEADFLIVVNERKSTPLPGNPAAKSVVATLYIRKNGELKPATKMSSSSATFWSVAAENIVKKAIRWINENAGVDSIPNKPSIDLTPFVGRYNSQGNKSDYIELKADGTLFLRQKGKEYSGRYDIKDSVITIVVTGITSKGEILGNTITDSGKGKWIK